MTPQPASTQSPSPQSPASQRTSWPPEDQDELRALAKLGFKELTGAVRGIGDIHGAVAERVFKAVGPGGAIVRAAHDAISRAAYTAVSGGPTAAGKAADVALGKRDRTGERRLSTTPWCGLPV